MIWIIIFTLVWLRVVWRIAYLVEGWRDFIERAQVSEIAIWAHCLSDEEAQQLWERSLE